MSKSGSFERKSLREKVFGFLMDKPNTNIYDLYFEFHDSNKNTLKNYKYQYLALKKNNSIKWDKLKLVNDVINYKTVPAEKLNKLEKEAMLYFQELINKNCEGD